jgi:hypothetical protein
VIVVVDFQIADDAPDNNHQRQLNHDGKDNEHNRFERNLTTPSHRLQAAHGTGVSDQPARDAFPATPG